MDDASRTISIPGPRSWETAFMALWLAFWYGFILYWLTLLMAGHGTLIRGSAPQATTPFAWVMWIFFAAFPLGMARRFVWSAFGCDRVTVRGGVLSIDREAMGVRLYRTERYDVATVANVRDEGLPPGRSRGWAFAVSNPSERGAVVFDVGDNTVRLGASLLDGRDEARSVANALRSWVSAE